MSHRLGKSALRSRTALALLFAATLGLAGCQTNDVTGSLSSGSTATQRNLDTLEKRIQKNPDDNAAVIAYSKALYDAKRPDEAGVALAQAIARKPGQGDLLREYGKLLLRTGRIEQGAQVLEQARGHNGDTWDTFSALGAAYDQLGKPEKAKAAYDAGLALNPSSATLLTNYGLHHAYKNDLKTAESYLRRAAAQPEADARTRQNLALVLGLQGRFDEAENILRQDLPPEQASQNIAYMRQMLKTNNSWEAIKNARS